jgi:hypothetical protein
MSVPTSSIHFVTVTPDKLDLEKSYFCAGHKILEVVSMHSFINSPSVNGFDLAAIFCAMI